MESNVTANKQNDAEEAQKPGSSSEDDFVRNLTTIHKSLKFSKNL